MLGVDLNSYFLDAFESGLHADGLAATLEFERHADTRQGRLSRKELETRPRVLDLDLAYGITPDFRALRVSAQIFLGPRRVRGSRIELTKVKPHSFTVQYLVPLPGDHKKSKEDERAARWAGLQGELADMVRAGFDEVVAMHNHAITTLGAPASKTKGERIGFSFGAGAGGAGRLEMQQGSRNWVRTNSGLVSVPQ